MAIQTIYKTRDGKTHTSLDLAEKHEEKLNNEFIVNTERPSIITDEDIISGVVEMSHEESFLMWQNMKDQNAYQRDNSGVGMHVGNINNDQSMPVHVTFYLSRFRGKRILEWEATSRFVDYTLIDKYLDLHFNGIYRTNSSNIHNVR